MQAARECLTEGADHWQWSRKEAENILSSDLHRLTYDCICPKSCPISLTRRDPDPVVLPHGVFQSSNQRLRDSRTSTDSTSSTDLESYKLPRDQDQRLSCSPSALGTQASRSSHISINVFLKWAEQTTSAALPFWTWASVRSSLGRVPPGIHLSSFGIPTSGGRQRYRSTDAGCWDEHLTRLMNEWCHRDDWTYETGKVLVTG